MVTPSVPDCVLGRPRVDDLIEAGVIASRLGSPADAQRQPASLDLTLDSQGHRLIGSFIPDRGSVAQRAVDLAAYDLSLDQPTVLETGQVYLFRLCERLRLPAHVRGRCNPKSSIGRVDVFTRVICDRHERFDEIPAGYDGPLWVEVYPRSFPVRVAAGLALTQLRLFAAGESADDGPAEIWAGGERHEVRDEAVMSLSLRADEQAPAGFRARRHTPVLDLTREAAADLRDFWEPVVSRRGGLHVLEPEAFYLFKSVERLRIPAHLAAEMVPVDPSYGELRTHYAGFFDPGFGWEHPQGVPAVLEVRAHDVPFAVTHGQSFFRLRLTPVCGMPEPHYGRAAGSHYHSQDLTHAKFFRSSWE